MGKQYNQYLSVDSDFIPVFSESSDKENPDKWKSFFAHDSFKSIISQLIDTLEKGNKDKDLPLWMHGAYGTGKTYASFVIKHILEDDLDDIKAYCDANEMASFYGRIAGIRNKGKILVVHRSSSAGVIGNNRLYNCIIESTKAALLHNGYSYMGGKSQYDNVLSMLKDPNAAFNFERAFEKYKIKFEGYADAMSVITDLEDLGVDDSVDLLENIVEVADLERFVFSSSYSDVIDWLDDVIKGNGIYAIVFIWDEFTEFFKNNQNNITGLQEIAQAASRINFYFFLITHSGSQIIADQNAKKIIEARFKIKAIDMAETTAFKLMGQAIKRDQDLLMEWNKVADGLWALVSKATQQKILANSHDTSEKEMKKLLPIHPYAAFLLKIIAKEISSNQRTMFQFLSGDYREALTDKHNFRWFIDTHNSEYNEWNFLTADYVWDYFFTDENVDLSDAFKSAIAQYENYKHLCEDDENKERVLKVVLLLTAIQQKNVTSRAQGQSTLLKANMSNISLAFVGTPISSMISNIMALFVSKGVFSTIQEGDDILYIPPVNNIDQERFDKMYDEIQRQLSFEKIISDQNCNISEQFLPNDFLKYRYKIYVVSIHNYKSNIEDANNLPANQIPAFYFYAANELDKAKINESIDKLYELISRPCITADYSATPLSDEEYVKYIHSKTEEKYYTADTNQGKLAKQNADKIIKDWKVKLNVTAINIRPNEDGQVGTIQGGGNIRKRLKEFNAKVFGCGLEEISVNDKLFETQGFKDKVALMAMNIEPISGNYSYLNNISSKLLSENIWSNPNYVNDIPMHAVSKMKKCVNDIVEKSFASNSMVAITDIWTELQKPPFGLMSCTGAAFLLGFLLRNYADGSYYKYDGANTSSLNYNNVAELIFTVVKGNSKANNQFIVKQKPEHVEFCRITGDIFKIAKDKQNSIQDIVKNISIYLKNNEYPLWPLGNYVEVELMDDDMMEALKKAIQLYCEIVSTKRMAGRDVTIIAEELYRLYKQYAGIDIKLQEIVCVENMKAGMAYYIAGYKPDLIAIINKLNVSSQTLLVDLNKKLSDDASYLWDICDTLHQIDNIYIDYCLIDSTNKVLAESKKKLSDVAESVGKKLDLIKMPIPMLLEVRPDLKNILFALNEVRTLKISDRTKIVSIITRDAETFNSFFANQISAFEEILRDKIISTTNEEIQYLFDSIDGNVSNIMPDTFIINLTGKLMAYRKNKKINKLISIWKDETRTTSPKDWSKKNKICILCAFEDDINSARYTFEFINKTRTPQNEDEIDGALEFLSKAITRIKDEEFCLNAMIDTFCGEYSYIIQDKENFQHYICDKLGDDAFAWADKRDMLKVLVDTYANESYSANYMNKVVKKIRDLSPEDAQTFLIELVKDKPLVGINILKK